MIEEFDNKGKYVKKRTQEKEQYPKLDVNESSTAKGSNRSGENNLKDCLKNNQKNLPLKKKNTQEKQSQPKDDNKKNTKQQQSKEIVINSDSDNNNGLYVQSDIVVPTTSNPESINEKKQSFDVNNNDNLEELITENKEDFCSDENRETTPKEP